MTHKEYKKRIEALGFNLSSWGRFVGLNRSTVLRQCSGEIEVIPEIYWRVIEWLEQGNLPNPNE